MLKLFRCRPKGFLAGNEDAEVYRLQRKPKVFRDGKHIGTFNQSVWGKRSIQMMNTNRRLEYDPTNRFSSRLAFDALDVKLQRLFLAILLISQTSTNEGGSAGGDGISNGGDGDGGNGD
ncbi:MAG: hypothetical protein ACFBZ8_13725 [Opitutales bacterium]